MVAVGGGGEQNVVVRQPVATAEVGLSTADVDLVVIAEGIGPPGAPGEDGAVEVYVQPDDPGEVPVGSIWIDTDDPVPSSAPSGQAPHPIVADEVWRYRVANHQPILSTPIISTMTRPGESATNIVVFQGWDWYFYVLNRDTGALIWRYAFGNEAYGRAQCADVNGDGRMEFFGAAHDGVVYCLADDGSTVLWRYYNQYDREGSGTATAGDDWSISDSTKNWPANSFQRYRSDWNAHVRITSGTGAGQNRLISGVDPNRIWITGSPWSPVPDTTSHYEVVPFVDSDTYWQHAGQLSKEGATWYLYLCGFDGQCSKINATTGAHIWGFNTLENIEPYPLVYDVNGDGQLEVVFGAVDGNVYCRKASDGTKVWTAQQYNGDALGWAPQGFDSFIDPPVDIDGDGRKELVVSGRTGRVHILDAITGVEKAQTTNQMADIDSRPALFPLADGKRDIFSGGDTSYGFRYRPDGSTVWRTQIGATGRYEINASPVIADIDGDGQVEVVVCDMGGGITFLDEHGTVLDQMFPGGAVEGVPYISDMDGDGLVEMICTTTDGYCVMYRFRRFDTVGD